MGTNGDTTKGFEFKKFATPRIVGGIAIVVIVLWALTIIFSSSDGPPSTRRSARQPDSAAPSAHSETKGHSTTTPGRTTLSEHTAEPAAPDKAHETVALKATKSAAPATQKAATHDATDAKSHTADSPQAAGAGKHDSPPHVTDTDEAARASHAATTDNQTAAHETSAKQAGEAPGHRPSTHQQPKVAAGHGDQTSTHGAASPEATKESTAMGHPLPETAPGAPVHKPTPKGVAFVEATIQPLNYELEERWWGWRPNDLIDITDNVNTFQLGVLEVTRRATVSLAERISRTGTTDAYDENLEQAMNWLMVKASSFWFPSAESKYGDSIEELQVYLEKLKAGKATFYTRTDNLIPLLASFEDLLGSCDENLVKDINEDGTPISFFSADDYFYYTQGVASAMATILEAVHDDFLLTLESRHATELLHHAIVSCQQAAALDPLIVLDRNLSSIFANHRANMAAPISHARFYLGQLIKTLST